MRRSIAAALIGVGLLAGCASQDGQQNGEVFDPIEPANRLVFAVNETLDIFILQPTAYVYKETVPDPVRDMVRNFLEWLQSPVVLANDLFQGDWENAEITASRFVANAPMFGLIDNATGLGLKRQNEDFGQTLGHYGADEGFYIVLPVFGPSNVRDSVGRVVDYFIDPVNYVGPEDKRLTYSIARGAGEAVDFRARNYAAINDLRETSVDYYARVRSIYKQRRDALIRDNEPPAPGAPAAGTPSSDGSGEFDNFEPTDTSEQTGAVSN